MKIIQLSQSGDHFSFSGRDSTHPYQRIIAFYGGKMLTPTFNMLHVTIAYKITYSRTDETMPSSGAKTNGYTNAFNRRAGCP